MSAALSAGVHSQPDTSPANAYLGRVLDTLTLITVAREGKRLILILIGIILIMFFVIAVLAAWTIGWFLWLFLVVGIILIMIRLLRRKR
ncbi:MAG: hypothetical protein WCP73_09550 [Eubacteriales bacterium]